MRRCKDLMLLLMLLLMLHCDRLIWSLTMNCFSFSQDMIPLPHHEFSLLASLWIKEWLFVELYVRSRSFTFIWLFARAPLLFLVNTKKNEVWADAAQQILLLIMRGHIYIYIYIYIYISIFVCPVVDTTLLYVVPRLYTVVGYFSLTVHRRVLTPLRASVSCANHFLM
jgi:hypothetical protein